MPKVHETKVVRALAGDVDIERQTAWIDFEADAENTLRVILPEDHLARLKLAIQQLQGASTDRRRAKGLPTLQTSYVAKVSGIEFGTDPESRVAVLRTRFETGEFQDTVLGADMVRDTIRFLETALAQFESNGPTKN